MATSELNQVLDCTICCKRFQNPKLLNCLHSFCLACLEHTVKMNGELTCPTCSKSYAIPEGGLQKLSPNTFLNNLLETIEHFSEIDQIKCACKKGEEALYYCQDCRQYLCSTCIDHHKEFQLFANHKLHSVEDVLSMNHIQKASLHPPQCLLHNKPLEFYCENCTIPICVNCIIMDKELEGNHKQIGISKAFQTFKETSEALEKAANDCKNKLHDGLQAVILNATKLEQSKDTTLRDIDNHVQVMIRTIKENGDNIKNEVETIYKKKKKANNVQMVKLKMAITDINTKLSFLNHLLKSDEATAMQSSEKVIAALKDRMNELPNTEPDDNGHIQFLINKQQLDIGNVTQLKVADCLTLKGEESVTQCQKIVVKIIKTNDCEIYANQLTATWTQPTGETYITQAEEDDNGDYFVTGTCTSSGVCKLDVSADDTPINQSPQLIKVEKEGLVNTIKINEEYIKDLIKCEDDCLLVSCATNEILKYKQSGEYIGKVTLPQGVKVNRMFKMKNGNIAFSDFNARCIKVCNKNGLVTKSIGQEKSMKTSGMYIDETSNVAYVGGCKNGSVFMFDIDSGQTS
ncbi:tripartite motif-containing protein 45-like [Anneissia japonica]|uniref:tripartite motif-containing protein 45-like n=1 Tax=Anneissia japonica TaxID=1529436 RepID=UPI0014256106|nr:tripartite motif-containing protein 45-like [Anneissia japonica]